LSDYNNRLKPMFKWSGGKRREISLFAKHYPKNYDIFVEPFVGGGAVYFDLNFEGKNVIADVHDEVINFYKQCRSFAKMQEMKSFLENPWQNLLRSSRATENQKSIYEGLPEQFKNHGEATYYFMRDGFRTTNDFKKAAKFYYLRKTAYRGMIRYNPRGDFNIPWGKYKSISLPELDEERYSELLSRTEIKTQSFEKTFDRYGKKENAFIFLDPPYDSEFSDYKTGFGRKEQEKLAECFKSAKAKCLMIIGKTDFISSLYSDYIVEEYHKSYAFKIHSGRIKPEDINNFHLVIKNYT